MHATPLAGSCDWTCYPGHSGSEALLASLVDQRADRQVRGARQRRAPVPLCNTIRTSSKFLADGTRGYQSPSIELIL